MVMHRARHQAESFAAALEGRAGAARELTEDLAELVVFTEDLRAEASVAPSEEFVARLRADLMAEARTVLVRSPSGRRPATGSLPLPSRARRRAAVALTSIIVAAGGAGLSASSAAAVPGDMLYPVKRGLESAQSVLYRSEVERAAFAIELADTRLAEAMQLSAAGAEPARVNASLDEFTTLVSDGAGTLVDEYESSGDDDGLRTLSDFTEKASTRLVELGDTAPEESGRPLGRAAEVVALLRDRVVGLCADCESETPRALEDLRDAVERAAGNRPEETAGEGSPGTGDSPSGQQTPPSTTEDSGSDGSGGGKKSTNPPKGTEGSDGSEGGSGSGEAGGGGLLDPITGLLGSLLGK